MEARKGGKGDYSSKEILPGGYRILADRLSLKENDRKTL
jgi:hypothetical protein